MSSSEAPLLETLCCVPNCVNSYVNGGCAQFYYFPVNAQLSKVWKDRISNPNIMHLTNDALKRLQICNLHFEEINKSKGELKKNSLPTLGLPTYSEPPSRENCFAIASLQLTSNNLQSICRVCYSQEDLYDLSKSKYKNLTIEYIYNNLTNDKYFAKLTSFPSNVCLSCIELLIQSMLLLEQIHNAATVFEQLLTQGQRCINVITSDFELSLDGSLKNCQLERKPDFYLDNGVKNQHFASVFLPPPLENPPNNPALIKTEYHNKNVNNPLSESFDSSNTPISNNKDSSSNEIAAKDSSSNETAARDSSSNEISAKDSSSNEIATDDSRSVIAGQSSNPIVMSYSTFVRTTRRSSNVNVEPQKYLDTNSGPVIISYLTEEGSNELNPSSVQLPISSGRFSGIVKAPAVDIRCNMDLKTHSESIVPNIFTDLNLSNLNIPDLLEVQMDVGKNPEESDGAKIYRCEQCSEEFFDKLSYKRHKKEHNTKKFMCTICQATFNTGTECSKHKMTHTRACEVCGKNIQRKCYMNHLKTHDEDHSERYEQVKLKGHKLCNKCGRVFKRRWAFHAPCHTSAAPGKFQCDKCPFRTHYHKTLKQHLLIHAPPGDQFVCAICGDCFGTEEVLAKHSNQQHVRSVKLLPCKWCPSKFETRYERTKHLITDHGKKPLKEYQHSPTKFKCNYCSMTFVTADNLRLHLWSHPNATDSELELNSPSTSKANKRK